MYTWLFLTDFNIFFFIFEEKYLIILNSVSECLEQLCYDWSMLCSINCRWKWWGQALWTATSRPRGRCRWRCPTSGSWSGNRGRRWLSCWRPSQNGVGSNVTSTGRSRTLAPRGMGTSLSPPSRKTLRRDLPSATSRWYVSRPVLNFDSVIWLQP